LSSNGFSLDTHLIQNKGFTAGAGYAEKNPPCDLRACGEPDIGLSQGYCPDDANQNKSIEKMGKS
jgi:hypothetical protein